MTQQPLSAMTLVVRTADESTAAALLLRQAAQAADRAQPVTQVRWLRDWLDETTAERRFTSFLSGAFAGRRIDPDGGGHFRRARRRGRAAHKGDRCAGGYRRGPGTGRPHDPRWGITAAASGIAIGLVAAVALRPVLEALLFGVSVRDPVTYVVVGATPATVVLLACYVPAVRATKIEPLLALRCD